MRQIATVLVCVAAGWTIHASGNDRQAPPDAAAVLARSRSALGGDALDRVKSFVVTGRTRKLQGENLVPIEFEIACELPDKYVRRDEIPAQESGPTSRGFNGDRLIQLPVPAAPPPGREGGAGRAGAPSARGGPPPGGAPPPAGPPAAGRAAAPAFMPPKGDPLSTAKQDFVRLTLGMFASSFPAYPLTFVRVGQAQAPQGTAEVIDVKGPDGSNVALRLLVSGDSGLPLMISWQMPASNVIVTVPGQSQPASLAPGTVVVEGPPVPAADATKEVVEAFTAAVAALRKKAQATLVEHRLYYSDYREVAGARFPFRLRRAIGADTVEETNIDEFKINPRIDPRKFEVVR